MPHRVPKESGALLQRWNGHRAELLSMRRSHRTLRILVGDRPFEGENLVISCVDPGWVQAPISWAPCSLAVEVCKGEGDDRLLRVVDSDHGVCIRCGKVEFAENVQRLEKLA
jgi:hypothetical protein